MWTRITDRKSVTTSGQIFAPIHRAQNLLSTLGAVELNTTAKNYLARPPSLVYRPVQLLSSKPKRSNEILN